MATSVLAEYSFQSWACYIYWASYWVGLSEVRTEELRDLVIEKSGKKLSTWKRHYLSLWAPYQGELSNLPIYYMSLFKMPKMVSDWIMYGEIFYRRNIVVRLMKWVLGP